MRAEVPALFSRDTKEKPRQGCQGSGVYTVLVPLQVGCSSISSISEPHFFFVPLRYAALVMLDAPLY